MDARRVALPVAAQQMTDAKQLEQVAFFVSYTSSDLPWAEWIAWQLEDAGYRCHLQAWDFRAGTNFVDQMDSATRLGKQTVAVLSPAYLDSDYARSEWAAAIRRDPTGTERALVPVRVEDCNPEGLLGSIQRIDLVGVDEGEAKHRLLTGVRTARPKPVTSPHYPGGPTRPPKPAFPPHDDSGVVSSTDPVLPWRPILVAAAALSIVAAIAIAIAFVWPDGAADKPPITQVGVSPRSLALGAGSPDLLWVADPTQPEVWWLGADDERLRTNQIFLDATARPTGVAIDERGRNAWVIDEANDRAWRIDMVSRRRAGHVNLGTGTGPQSVTVADGIVWVANRDGRVSRIDAITGQLKGEAIRIGSTPLTSITAGGGAVWVTDTKGDAVWRIDPRSPEPDATMEDYPAKGPRAVAFGEGSAWVASRDGTVSRIDSDGITKIKVSNELCGIAVGDGAVWVSDPADNRVWRIDPASNAIDGDAIEVEDAPCAVAAGDGAVWVANRGDSSISRIEP